MLRLTDRWHPSVVEFGYPRHVLLHAESVFVGPEQLAKEQTADIKPQPVRQPQVGPCLGLDIDPYPLISEGVGKGLPRLVNLVDGIVAM